MGPDHLRALALTCAVLVVIGILALVRHDDPRLDVARRTGTLVAAEGTVPSDGPAPDVPSTLLPLFPTTSTTRASRATSTVTAVDGVETVSSPPALGTYAYSLSGTETLNRNTRALPSSMTLTAHRNGASGPREIVVDLRLSDQHFQRETWVFAADRIGVRHRAVDVTMGLTRWSSNAAASPAIGYAALPFVADATRSGSSEVHDGDNQLLRVEDWKVTDIGPRRLPIVGATVRAWEVTIDRTSRPGAVEQLRETRRAWFDVARRIWVRWETTMHGERTANGLTTRYDLTYVATLTGFTPAPR